MTKMTDDLTKSTIARGRTGEEAALVAIYECYKPRIQRFLYYRVRDRQASEDLTTDVFLRVLQNLPSYRFQGSPFQAWLFQIARNVAVDHIRKQNVRNDEPFDEGLVANDEPPDEIAHRRMLSAELQEALLELTEDQLDVVSLRFIASLSIAEVAQALDKSEGAVKSLQVRGLRTLAKRLQTLEVTYER